MADIVLSSVVDGIIRGLGSAAVNEIALLWGVNDELSKLQETISTIKAVLLDAEKKQINNNEVRAWLERLENVFYDADDLVDEFDTEAALRNQLERSKMMTMMKMQVRTFFSSSNQLALRHKLGRKINAIRDRLEAVRKERKFHLDETFGETIVESIRSRETHSDKPEKEVVGRDKDKMAIVECLLDPSIKENLCVVPIVGCGGLGKTTLAKLVFNDDKIERHFNLKVWVFVSNNDFNVRSVIQKILKSSVDQKDNLENLEMDQLQKRLQKEIVGKRCLLVLDDVWNENRELWLELKGLLAKCGKGSGIIITTRSKVVAEITSTMKPYVLERLDKEESWSLFKNVAFRDDHLSNDSHISDIGREIADKCGGIPLAIRTIGRMLYNRNPKTEWPSFLKMEFSKIDQDKCDILPTLKLSYDNLPPHLKRCFAFCKLYIKGHEINVRILINLWMALGFISKSSYQTQVDVGYGYYLELLGRSFFQEEWDDCLFVKRCKMHDLMHDLATQVGGTTYALLQANKEYDGGIFGSTRHISFNAHLDSLHQIRIPQSQASMIRTIYLPRQTSKTAQGRSSQSIRGEVVSLKLARVLDLCNMGIQVVPRCVGKLKHLRFLDLSYNEDIKALPDCITTLYNLQTLILSRCKNLQTLPKNIGSLVNLVNLYTEDCESLTHMPQGFDKMTKLQLLTHFVLNSVYDGSGQVGELRDLMRLDNLEQFIQISNLGNGEDTRNANLKEKQGLQSLCLHWCGDHPYYSNIYQQAVEDAEYDIDLPLHLKGVDYKATLEGLQPHQNLRGLTLEYYEGVRFSSWLPSLENLEQLAILYNRNCQYLPPLNQFVSLKVLKIVKVVGLEYISENSSSSCTTSPLPSLEEIYFESLPNLKGWWRDGEEAGQDGCNSFMSTVSFPCLVESIIYGCPKSAFLPASPHLKTLAVGKNNWKPFQQALMANILGTSPSSSSMSSSSSFSNLTTLGLYNTKHLQCLPDCFQNLTSLQVLFLVHCYNLKRLSPGIQYLVSSLQELRICACNELKMLDTDYFPWKALENLRLLLLRELPEMVRLPEGLRHLTSLQNLDVNYCDNLRQIPYWIGNLKSLNKLSFDGGPNLMSLPEGISQLTSLQKLKITDCSEILLQRCQKEKGEDWPKVAHIPKLVLKPTPNDQGSSWKIFKKFQIPMFSRKFS